MKKAAAVIKIREEKKANWVQQSNENMIAIIKPRTIEINSS